jgi:L,D-peptidoglycan transpeptidase YkuD (ErfK/YbiS/YcfS/YnhG family)
MARHRALVGRRRARALASALTGLLLVTGGVALARLSPGATAPQPVQAVPDARPLPPPPAPPPESARVPNVPAFATRLPARTRQVVRTVSSRRWCAHRWCTVTQAWHKGPDGGWRMLRSFRSTIGPNGFGKRREGDMRSPSGVYRIVLTFSTGRRAPGAMPWRRRLPTSNVTGQAGRFYNTWIEEPGRTDGDRPSMRYGFWIDYNNPRVRAGAGPRPVPGRGSGIFYHTSRPGQRWIPTAGCTQLGDPRSMRWVVRWLRPAAHPRVVQDL